MTTINTLPAHELNRFALRIANATEEYFKNPETMKRFEAWKRGKESESDDHTA